VARYQIDPSVTSRAQEHPSQRDAARYTVTEPEGTSPRAGRGGPFFHATTAELQPGEQVLSPRDRGTGIRPGNKRSALAHRNSYITSSPAFVRKYADEVMPAYGGEAEHQIRTVMGPRGEYPVRVPLTKPEAHVYEVEPTGSFRRDEYTRSTPFAYRTEHPVNVVDEVHLSPSHGRPGEWNVTRKSHVPPEAWEKLRYPERAAQREQAADAQRRAGYESRRDPAFDSLEMNRLDNGLHPAQVHGPDWQAKFRKRYGADWEQYL
jgi:hypothetical protein